ncbi:MAG TPA: hypothetical protein V6D00_08260 [Pantanalinema sp.]
MSAPASRPWIPPAALITGQLAHGASWLLLMAFAWPSTPGLSMPGLAWIHAVALGWLTLTALGVMVHVIPGFLDIEWIAEGVARWSLLPFALGVLLLVAGFALTAPIALSGGAVLILLGLLGFAGPALATVLSFKPPAGTKAPFRFSFTLVLGALGVAAALGATMAWALAGAPWGQVLGWLPPIHAVLAGGGWLTLLIIGVSTRTLFPVTGRRRADHKLRFHVWVSSGLTLGFVLLLVGLLPGVAHPAWRWAGLAALAIAAVLYAIDGAELVIGAPNDHKPPIAFVSMTLIYLVATVLIGLGVNAGHPEWQAALAFVGLIGWMGQSVNGYLMHIGIRLLTTVVRGDDDETRPGQLLVPWLSWTAFVATQAAVVGGTALLLLGLGHYLPWVGACGLVGWVALMVNVRMAYLKARKWPQDPEIPLMVLPLS